MNAALRGLRVENTPLVTTLLVRIDVTRAGQVMDKAAPTLTSAPLASTLVSRIHIVMITRDVIRVPATKDGNANCFEPYGRCDPATFCSGHGQCLRNGTCDCLSH